MLSVQLEETNLCAVQHKDNLQVQRVDYESEAFQRGPNMQVLHASAACTLVLAYVGSIVYSNVDGRGLADLAYSSFGSKVPSKRCPEIH